MVEDDAQGPAAAAADDHRRPEDAAGAAAADGQAGRDDLAQGDREQDGGRAQTPAVPLSVVMASWMAE